MNEFTKEELQLISGSLFGSWVNSLTDASTFRHCAAFKNLHNKTRAMIDNYDKPQYNPDCYCGQLDRYGDPIMDCGYPPHEVQE